MYNAMEKTVHFFNYPKKPYPMSEKKFNPEDMSSIKVDGIPEHVDPLAELITSVKTVMLLTRSAPMDPETRKKLDKLEKKFNHYAQLAQKQKLN